jgi:hypothetical protein
MRALVLGAVIVSACAVGHASTFIKRGYQFRGERLLTLQCEEDDFRQLAPLLERKGFKVVRGLPEQTPTTRYALGLSGGCSTASPLAERLAVSVFDGPYTEKVFGAHLENTWDCPRGFYVEVAEALDRNWDDVDWTVKPRVGLSPPPLPEPE